MKDLINFVLIVILSFAFVIVFSIGVNEYHKRHPPKYETYEIVILDKYDDIGSSWHIVGGRASETEYHIVYKYRNKTKNTYWRENTLVVDGTRYRKYKIGYRFTLNQLENSRLPPYLP